MAEIEIDSELNEIPEHAYSECNNIQTVDISNLTFNKFFMTYLLKNIPCTIKNICSLWECNSKWICEDGKINYDYLVFNYGDLEAPIADCSNIKYNAQCKENMKVKDFLAYMKSDRSKGLLYLKDWHLKKIKPNDIFYKTPTIFLSDWLNEFAQDHNEDDFKFVYIGPKDSWTPLHTDVYSSYSWSVNVVGRKKWIFIPPGEEEKLKDNLGNLPLLFDPKKHENITYFEVYQEKGDAIFVPSGWHHQVTNVQDTISINHNWINACNIREVWKALQANIRAIEYEIEHLKDTSDYLLQCENILKSLFGMDTNTYVNFICFIATKRIAQFKDNRVKSNDISLGKNLVIFDIRSIKNILEYILKVSEKQLTSNVKKKFLETLQAVLDVLNN